MGLWGLYLVVEVVGRGGGVVEAFRDEVNLSTLIYSQTNIM